MGPLYDIFGDRYSRPVYKKKIELTIKEMKLEIKRLKKISASWAKTQIAMYEAEIKGTAKHKKHSL